MSHYIHNIDPIMFEINIPSIIPFLPEQLEIRWYGLAYLLGFLVSYNLLKYWSKKNLLKIPEKEVSNFILIIALFGVFLGGRLGYCLLYDFDYFYQNKASFFEIWKGGMSSHGGFIGVIIVMLWYAKKHSVSFWNLSDHLAASACLGIAFGRIANFINGELWGRVTTVKWAVIFPQSNSLDPRHPSQLYQALCEGFLVFFLLLMIRKTSWGKQSGVISCCFLLFYAIARIAIEFLREPDNLTYFEWVTKGQLYSIFMIISAGIIIYKKKLFIMR